ncbi:hypothetical protein [Leptospira santarosai]|uniref:hypothetical protein n=1 Tax=Leptospira santarosai TaxID=28183 RepID=UPI0026E3A103|nr:hypothetical protein [Leptospira santarosai]MDO6384141.1 hypothetical protein [Leptospira santarosai]
MTVEIDSDVKKEAIQGLIRPFSERFNHPILSWVIVFSVYFHIMKIAKFVLFLYDSYQPPNNRTIFEDIGSEVTYCNIFGPVILGTIVGFLFPLFDAGFSKWIAKVQKWRANWISNELSKIYKTNILFLDSALRNVLDIIENPIQNDILQQLDKGVTNRLKVVRGVKTLEVGQCVKFDNAEGIIYPSQGIDHNSYGIIIKKLNNDLYIVLQEGRINNEELKQKFPEKDSYWVINSKWQHADHSNPKVLIREGDWITVQFNNTHSDSQERRFMRFYE